VAIKNKFTLSLELCDLLTLEEEKNYEKIRLLCNNLSEKGLEKLQRSQMRGVTNFERANFEFEVQKLSYN